jgi:hypothetical protein
LYYTRNIPIFQEESLKNICICFINRFQEQFQKKRLRGVLSDYNIIEKEKNPALTHRIFLL